MPPPSEDADRGVQEEADREQQIIDLDPSIGDREQAINERQQGALTAEQAEILHQAAIPTTETAKLAVVRRRQERLDHRRCREVQRQEPPPALRPQ